MVVANVRFSTTPFFFLNEPPPTETSPLPHPAPLPTPRRSRDQDDVPPRNAAEENFVEPLDPCLLQVRFRHAAPPALERSRRVQACRHPSALTIAAA